MVKENEQIKQEIPEITAKDEQFYTTQLPVIEDTKLLSLKTLEFIKTYLLNYEINYSDIINNYADSIDDMPIL